MDLSNWTSQKPLIWSRDKFKKFLQTTEIYLGINKKVYNDDLKKIGFILSFMTEGQAEAWANQFVEEAWTQNPGPDLNLRTYEEFVKTLKVTFLAYDSPGDALNKMKNLWMKYDDDIDKHIMTFATLLSKSRLDKKSTVIVDIFRETLPVKLQSKIMNLETPPTDLDGWYKWAKEIDNTAKQTRVILGKTKQNSKKTGTGPCYFFPWWERDPNAMDVDALSLEERGKLMKEGKCFHCRKTRHLAKDCPDKGDQKKKEEPKKKWEGKKLYTHIRSLYQEMDKEEREEFMKQAEEMGFWKGEMDQRQSLLSWTFTL